MSQGPQVVPEGLKELIKSGISTAFPESSNAAGGVLEPVCCKKRQKIVADQLLV
jgi:hypothetical protein